MVDVIKFAQNDPAKAKLGEFSLSPMRDYSAIKAPYTETPLAEKLSSGVNYVKNSPVGTSVSGLMSKVSTPAGIKKAAASAGGALLSGTAAKVSGALSGAVSSVTGGLSGLLGGDAGSGGSIGATSEHGISREAWDVRSGKTTTPIAFNINPSSVDFNFQGRGASSLTSTGRVFDRFVANANQGQMVFDLSFQMQTGSLLSPEMKATEGHKVLHGIMELLNEPLRLEDGSVNLQVLRINTVRYGYMELTGLFSLESGFALSESADDPFKGDYMLTFQVVHSSPPITLAASLIQSVEKAGYD